MDEEDGRGWLLSWSSHQVSLHSFVICFRQKGVARHSEVVSCQHVDGTEGLVWEGGGGAGGVCPSGPLRPLHLWLHPPRPLPNRSEILPSLQAVYTSRHGLKIEEDTCSDAAVWCAAELQSVKPYSSCCYEAVRTAMSVMPCELSGMYYVFDSTCQGSRHQPSWCSTCCSHVCVQRAKRGEAACLSSSCRPWSRVVGAMGVLYTCSPHVTTLHKMGRLPSVCSVAFV